MMFVSRNSNNSSTVIHFLLIIVITFLGSKNSTLYVFEGSSEKNVKT